MANIFSGEKETSTILENGTETYPSQSIIKKELQRLADLNLPFKKRLESLINIWNELSFCENGNLEASAPIFTSLYRWTGLCVLSRHWSEADHAERRSLARIIAQCCSSHSSQCSYLLVPIFDPWGDPLLHRILAGDSLSTDEAFRFISSEGDDLLLLRVEILVEEHLPYAALQLCQWAVEFIQESAPTALGEKDLKLQGWLFHLLHLHGRLKELVEQVTKCSCHDGIRILTRLREDPRFLVVAELVCSVFLLRDLLHPASYCCTKPLMESWCDLQVLLGLHLEAIKKKVEKLVFPYCPSSAHFYILVDVLWERFGMSFLPLYIELFIHGLSHDINMLTLVEPRSYELAYELEKALAQVYRKMADLFSEDYPLIAHECLISSFSLEPSQKLLGELRKSLLAKNNGFKLSLANGFFHPILSEKIPGVSDQLLLDLSISLECTRTHHGPHLTPWRRDSQDTWETFLERMNSYRCMKHVYRAMECPSSSGVEDDSTELELSDNELFLTKDKLEHHQQAVVNSMLGDTPLPYSLDYRVPFGGLALLTARKARHHHKPPRRKRKKRRREQEAELIPSKKNHLNSEKSLEMEPEQMEPHHRVVEEPHLADPFAAFQQRFDQAAKVPKMVVAQQMENRQREKCSEEMILNQVKAIKLSFAQKKIRTMACASYNKSIAIAASPKIFSKSSQSLALAKPRQALISGAPKPFTLTRGVKPALIKATTSRPLAALAEAPSCNSILLPVRPPIVQATPIMMGPILPPSLTALAITPPSLVIPFNLSYAALLPDPTRRKRSFPYFTAKDARLFTPPLLPAPVSSMAQLPLVPVSNSSPTLSASRHESSISIVAAADKISHATVITKSMTLQVSGEEGKTSPVPPEGGTGGPRSLASISDAVRVSLMVMDDATLENQVQSCNTFSQDTLTFGCSFSTASSCTTSPADLTRLATASRMSPAINYRPAHMYHACQQLESFTAAWGATTRTKDLKKMPLPPRQPPPATFTEDEVLKERIKEIISSKEDAQKATPDSTSGSPSKFWCDLCQRGFCSAYNLRRHYKNVHKDLMLAGAPEPTTIFPPRPPPVVEPTVVPNIPPRSSESCSTITCENPFALPMAQPAASAKPASSATPCPGFYPTAATGAERTSTFTPQGSTTPSTSYATSFLQQPAASKHAYSDSLEDLEQFLIDNLAWSTESITHSSSAKLPLVPAAGDKKQLLSVAKSVARAELPSKTPAKTSENPSATPPPSLKPVHKEAIDKAKPATMCNVGGSSHRAPTHSPVLELPHKSVPFPSKPTTPEISQESLSPNYVSKACPISLSPSPVSAKSPYSHDSPQNLLSMASPPFAVTPPAIIPPPLVGPPASPVPTPKDLTHKSLKSPPPPPHTRHLVSPPSSDHSPAFSKTTPLTHTNTPVFSPPPPLYPHEPVIKPPHLYPGSCLESGGECLPTLSPLPPILTPAISPSSSSPSSHKDSGDQLGTYPEVPSLLPECKPRRDVNPFKRVCSCCENLGASRKSSTAASPAKMARTLAPPPNNLLAKKPRPYLNSTSSKTRPSNHRLKPRTNPIL